MEGSFGEPFQMKFLRDPLDVTFLGNTGEIESFIEKSMPTPVLSDTKIEDAWQRREYVENFFRTYRGVTS